MQHGRVDIQKLVMPPVSALKGRGFSRAVKAPRRIGL
jgi:hypothetical protein